MASTFGLNASEISNAITELTNDNAEFRSAVQELETTQSELKSMWQGDAYNIFNQYFEGNKGTWDTFAKTMDSYIETLSKILKAYETAEETNKETARITTV